MRAYPLVLALMPAVVDAQELPPCPPPYSICLTEEQKEKVVGAVKELDEIKSSPAKVEVQEPVVIIRDWQGRVYVNGGDNKPIPLKLTIGGVVDRNLEMTLPVRVYEREEPPDPIFRARFRAQAGLMVPEIVRSAMAGSLQEFWFGGVDLDFLHYNIFNVNIHIGTSGAGGGLGLDITKNMGVSVGAIVKWDDWGPGLTTGVYFAL